MVRGQIKVDIPDEWMENMKHGRCWCSKDHNEFEANQKFYCSQAHADDYSKRITYWSKFKTEILERDNETCTKCGRNEKSFKASQNKLERQFYRDKAKLYPKAIDMARKIKLKELQEQFEQIMDDAYVMEHMDYHVSEEFDLPRIRFEKTWFNMEVDHIIPVALGGEMWNPENLHSLCNDCHKVKTKEDMIKIRKAKESK